MEQVVAWFFILGAPITTGTASGPNMIGPMAKWQCEKVDAQITQEGQCQKIISVAPCPKDGKKHNIVECPVFTFALPGKEPKDEPMPAKVPTPPPPETPTPPAKQ